MTILSNPLGAHRRVTTFVANADADGDPLIQPDTVRALRAAAAIQVGDVLEYVAPTATVPLSVQPMATASAATVFAGVALEPAESGQSCLHVPPCGGIVRVRTGDVTTALGERLTKPATVAGVGVTTNAAVDATTVAGTTLGVVVGNDDGTFTPVDLSRHF